jgi:hypothetical protein
VSCDGREDKERIKEGDVWRVRTIHDQQHCLRQHTLCALLLVARARRLHTLTSFRISIEAVFGEKNL